MSKVKNITGSKFADGSAADGKHYWLTPPDLYRELDAEFNFDFDPCPYPLPDGFNGLECEWGQRNYVNPPFGSVLVDGRKKGITAWIRKAKAEAEKGKLSVVVYPIDKWIFIALGNVSRDFRNLGDVRWHATEDGSPGKGTGRHIACFVIRPTDQPRCAPTGAADIVKHYLFPPPPKCGEATEQD